MPAIKASTFNVQNLQNQISVNPPPPPKIIKGVPNVAGNADTAKIVSMQTELIRNQIVNVESLPQTQQNVALTCLSGLGISLKPDSNPGFSLLRNNNIKIGNPNIMNPQIGSSVNLKEDGSKMFPEKTDPWHEHDAAIPDYLIQKQQKLAQHEIKQKTDPATLVAGIFDLNKSKKVPASMKMKQFDIITGNF